MRVLWLCNIMLPVIAMHLGKEVNNKEGWLSGTYDRLKKSGFRMANGEKIELGVCFPVGEPVDEIQISLPNIKVYGFYEDTVHPECYDEKLENKFKQITKDFNPDIVHCFGTEYPHTLAMTKAFDKPEKILIGIQGLCYKCADAYMVGVPEVVQKTKTFRDVIKKDSMLKQKEKFEMRGQYEKEALTRAMHVTGRTHWDRECVGEISSAKYHFMNETLRSVFYDGMWDEKECVLHSIFMSQGDYPLKGLHIVLEALPKILEKYPDTLIYVAGNDLTAYKSLKQKLKISGYGKYLRYLMKKNGLLGHIKFLGKLSAKEMKERYLKSNLYVCASSLENSPNSLGEAMLLGVPAVAPYTGGIPSIFEKDKDGLMFEPGNASELAEKIIYLFEHPTKMLEYALQAKEHAKVTHNPEANYRRLLEIYQEIL